MVATHETIKTTKLCLFSHLIGQIAVRWVVFSVEAATQEIFLSICRQLIESIAIRFDDFSDFRIARVRKWLPKCWLYGQKIIKFLDDFKKKASNNLPCIRDLRQI